MLIHEVCNRCGLTKKAVEYYEQQGLIAPQILENGYRDYDAEQVSTLKEIAVLRRCGLSIPDIRIVLTSTSKPVALARYKHLNELRIRRLNAGQDCIERLINTYDIDATFLRLQQSEISPVTIRERLILSFPGSYGLFLSFHFGRFLDVPIETAAQRDAYEKVIAYLDNVSSQIPQELQDYLEQIIPVTNASRLSQYESDLNRVMEETIADPDSLLQSLDFERYIAYRTSDDFAQSPAGRMVVLLTEFQKNSGYSEVFLEGLRLLSPAYRQYCDRLEKANKVIIEKYPQLERLYNIKGSPDDTQNQTN